MEMRLPQLGEGADSGKVVRILVKEGDQIEKDDAVIELENEKAVASIPAPQAGVVDKILVQEGDEISVGDPVLRLSDDSKKDGEPEDEKPDQDEPEPPEEEEAKPEESAGDDSQERPETEEPERRSTPAASPLVRKVAAELGIDLGRVRGSERGGRIVMDDLRAYVVRLQKIAFEEKPSSEQPTPPSDFERWGPVRREAMSELRMAIRRRTSQAWATVPHVHQFDDADIGRVLDLKEKHAAGYEKHGSRLTLTAFVLKALAAALKKHPAFNASLDPDSGEIVFKDYLHLGVAVDVEGGVLVPVIRDVDRKSMVELGKELETLVGKARDRKLTADEMEGASFALSNQGAIGSGHFTPIVSPPAVAVLGLGRARKMPVARDGRIEPRPMLPLTLGYDHRIVDGAGAARFMVSLVEALENFDEEVVKP